MTAHSHRSVTAPHPSTLSKNTKFTLKESSQISKPYTKYG